MEALGKEDPREIGPYRVLRLLGQGGMGRVYVAAGRGGRLVAVKVILDRHQADDAYQRRFKHEVLAARTVRGPFTAALVAADPDAERPWLATEYVPAPALQEAVAHGGPLPLPALLVLARGLAEALVAIHGAGLVHRDLNPRNVLVTAAGPRVIDFGIARIEGATALTATGHGLGTPGYMAPEQIRGVPGPASDVFALGATVAFAARGAGPFGGGEAGARVARTLSDDPDLGGVPPLLLPVVHACLAKDPGERPTPAGLVALLDDAAELLAADLPSTVGASPKDDDATVWTQSGVHNDEGWLPGAVRELIDRHQAEADTLSAEARHRVTRRRVLTGLAALALPGAAGAWYLEERLAGDEWQKPSVTWSFARSGQVFESAYPHPSGLVAASTTGALFRVAPDGTQVWQSALDTGVGLCIPFGEFVTALDKVGVWYVLDPASGRVVWRRPDVVSLEAHEGTAFAYGKDGVVRSLALDGSRPEAWSFDAGAPDGTVGLAGPDTLWVVARRGEEATALHDSVVHILDARTGQARGRQEFPRYSLWFGAVSGGTLVLSGNTLTDAGIPEGVVCGVALADAQRLWRQVTQSLVHAVVAGDGRVVTAEVDGMITVRFADTGNLEWNLAVNAGQALDGSVNLADWPVLADSRAHVGSEEGRVYTLDLKARRMPWTFTAPHVDGEPEQLHPFTSGGVVYAVGDKGRLYALRADTGAPLWRASGTTQQPYAGALPTGAWILRAGRIDALGVPR
ncbi:protein kinase domain-containing protein [Yinghuangia seranimata]|uniref:serine/threonine-protein kinase n=1 Tax=Yinghuangia seranimata TaxID=408067 RepID=UPI00248B975B|nr:serine/threonine-protein kinase [Yinghuangia seranimata]MDI2131135.1 PQQ-binding-like beta-propeller repeat protein [Yinghuangia seranimata]